LGRARRRRGEEVGVGRERRERREEAKREGWIAGELVTEKKKGHALVLLSIYICIYIQSEDRCKAKHL